MALQSVVLLHRQPNPGVRWGECFEGLGNGRGVDGLQRFETELGDVVTGWAPSTPQKTQRELTMQPLASFEELKRAPTSPYQIAAHRLYLLAQRPPRALTCLLCPPGADPTGKELG